ncbi:MAG: hypothetical protein IJG38_04085 [Thermoguttaceae bacterium]|nr:hypothetical protein [Thermoguttaceae bacterium]
MQTYGLIPLLFSLEKYGIEQDEIIRIVQKIVKRQKFSRDDTRLLARIEKALVQHYGNGYIKNFPKREWVRLSGRQYKVLNEQGERYGLSCLTEPDIDLTVLPRQLHDLLTKIAKKWDDLDTEEGLDGPASPWLEKYREQRAKQERLKLEQMRGELLPLDFVTEFWQRACAQIRAAGFKLEKKFGEEAKLLIDEAIDNIVADSMNSLGHVQVEPEEELEKVPEQKQKRQRRKKDGN